MEWKFTKIDHSARRELNLTLIEYAYLDYIFHVQSWPDGDGWCSDPYSKIKLHFDISAGCAVAFDRKFESMGLLEIIGDKRITKRKTTKKFYDHYRSENERSRSENERSRSENERSRSENERSRSENERYKGIKKVKKINNSTDSKSIDDAPKIILQTISSFYEEVKTEMHKGLSKRFEKHIVATVLENQIKEFIEYWSVREFRNSRGQKIKSLALTVSTWCKNGDDWGEVRKMYDRLMGGKSDGQNGQIRYSKEELKSTVKYDRVLPTPKLNKV